MCKFTTVNQKMFAYMVHYQLPPMNVIRKLSRVVYIRQLMTKLIDGFDLCDLSPLPHAAHPHCDHPRRVDPSNEIQMLQSSCVKLRRHPGCYPVGGKTINELLRNVLKILWSVLKLPHGNICVGAPPHLRHAWCPVARFLSLSLSISMGFSLWKKQ